MRRPRLAVFLMSWLFTSIAGCAEESYVQEQCEITQQYAAIWLAGTSNKSGTPRQRSVILGKDGPTISIGPINYAPDWKNIDEIRYAEQVSEETGFLTIEVIKKDGDRYTETAGVITDQCWISIGEFLKKNDIDVKLVTESNDD